MGKITPQILLTFIQIRKTPGKTIHHQLYEQLKNGIHEGLLRPLDRLPSSRELSKELKISRNSILQVFEQLTLEGFLATKIGAGTFIAEHVVKRSPSTKVLSYPAPEPQLAMARPYGLNNAFKEHSSSLEPVRVFQPAVPRITEFPFPVWGRLNASVHKQMAELHLGYDDAQGYFPLRKALADHLRLSRAINCDPDQLLIVNSTRQALHLIAELLLNTNDQCWMEDPGYPGARSAFQRFGGNICPVPILSDGIDLAYAQHHYPTAKLAYVTPSHQFPMGTTLSLRKRIQLLAWARTHHLWIIEDDYDSEFRYNSRPIPALQSMDTNGNVIYCGTISKVLLPAIRVGYLVLPSKAIARQFTIAKSAMDGHSNSITQAVVGEFIKQGHFSRHIRRMRLLYKKAQDELVSLINQYLSNQLTPIPAEAGMHLLAWLPSAMPAERLTIDALKEGVIIQPLSQYGIRFTHPNGVILGFAGYSFAQLEAGVLLLKRLLDTYR